MGKKIKVKIPDILKKTIDEDILDFGSNTNKHYNRLIEYYNDKKIVLTDIKSQGGDEVQFTLNKKNQDIYYQVLLENKIEIEAQYIRALCFEYVSVQKYRRERIIFEEKFERLEKYLKEKKKIEIKFNGKYRKINPYFIKYADRENRNYLFCFCETTNEYRNYRVLKIENMRLLSEDIEIKDKEYISEVGKNFDPFLSNKKYIKIKLTEKGREIMEKTPTNRPRLIKEEDGVLIYECSIKKAKVYFPQFFKEVEILEPTELAKWFKNMYKEAYEKYRELIKEK